MKRINVFLIVLLVALLVGCQPASQQPTEPTQPTDPTRPLHSDLYIEGLPVEDVIRYFNEVCLDAEFVNNYVHLALLEVRSDENH